VLPAKIRNAQLYGILDLAYVARERTVDVAHAMLHGGVDVLQVRGKGASLEALTLVAAELREMTAAAGVPLIINDFATVAVAIDADGVHVGQDDAMVASVRGILRRAIIGKSTHSISQAMAAEIEGADYIGFGPLFATPTKPDYAAIGLERIAEVQKKVQLPVFCIGGIKLENLQQVVDAGAQRVVIVSGLLQADDVASYAREAKAMLPPIR
jgi:thiamine-phosphate pyrophosphorylase